VKGKLIYLELCFDEVCFDKLALVWLKGFCWLSIRVVEMRFVLDGVGSRQGSTIVEFELVSEEHFCSFLSACLSVLSICVCHKKEQFSGSLVRFILFLMCHCLHPVTNVLIIVNSINLAFLGSCVDLNGAPSLTQKWGKVTNSTFLNSTFKTWL
jgi:hypothetical protein